MHSIYYNSTGIEVPSVTTILKVVNKPDLVSWAHYMGKIRMDIDKILDSSAKFGTHVHEYIEHYLSGKYYIPIDEELNVDRFKRTINNFKWFMKESPLNPFAMECSHSNERYGGTFDFYGEVDDRKILIDFKTSKRVYDTHLLQLGGYYGLVKDVYDIECAGILIVNEKKCELKTITLDFLKVLNEAFDRLVDFYTLYESIVGVN